MTSRSSFRTLFARTPRTAPRRKAQRPARCTPWVEQLENRLAPATITVNTTNDVVDGNTSSITALESNPGEDGHISLREAVIAVNNTGPGNTISIPAGTYKLTIAGTNETFAANGDLDIRASNTTLQGAGAATTTIQQTVAERVFDVNPTVAANFGVTFSGLTLTGGNAQGTFGGGAIIAGDSNGGGTTRLSNCVIIGNSSGKGPGGGVEVSAEGSLIVDNCTFSNNTASAAGLGQGGAIDFFMQGPGNLSVTGSTFTGNKAGSTGPDAGGAVHTSGNTGSNTFTLSQDTFTNNQATSATGEGGAISSDLGALTVIFSRFVGNTAGAGKGNTLYEHGAGTFTSTLTANDDWWGTNSGPSSPADTDRNAAGNNTLTTNNFLKLNIGAGSTTLNTGGSTTVTADFLHDSANNAISPNNLGALIGLPMTWSSTAGSLSNQQLTIQSNGAATATYTAGNTNGPGSASAEVDNATATVNFTINAASTTTQPTNAITSFSTTNHVIMLTGTVTSTAGPVNGGTFTFTIAGIAGSATSGTVANGTASATFTIPGGTAVGAHTITTVYSGSTNFAGSSAFSTLTVTKASPVFSNLLTPVIVYGTATTTLSGHLADGTNFPPQGETVSLTLGSVTQTPSLDASGNFTATFNTAALGVAGSPYTITYQYGGDANFTSASDRSTTLTVSQRTLHITATGVNKVYDGTSMATVTLSDDRVTGDVFTDSYTSASFADKNVGMGKAVSVSGITISGSDASNYTVNTTASTTANITARPLTVSAKSTSKMYGQTVTFAGTEFTTSGLVNGDQVTSVTLTSSGAAASAGVAGSPYAITPSAAVGSGLGNYTINYANGTLTVNPASLSASGVNFSATAGAPFSGTLATFTTPDTVDGAAAFTATITWEDGSTSSAGITAIMGSPGSFTVSGSHTFAAAGTFTTIRVQISNPNTQSATATDTATVTSLGQGVVKGLTGGIGFWHGPQGQALINNFNVTPSNPHPTALANWLAATFPNLYGANAGANNLTGKTNAQVAAFYLTLFALQGPKVDAEVLATALNVYATTSSWGGSAGAGYGFSVSATGLGACSYSVGSDGAAFGVANTTTRTVYGLLQAVNSKAVNGLLYNGDVTLEAQAADLFNGLNQAGSIG
jgi:hypothetical protein